MGIGIGNKIKDAQMQVAKIVYQRMRKK
jgi:hypothetical protein